MEWGKIARPHGILQVVDEQHRSVQCVASPSPRLGERTRVVDEIVDGSIISLRLIANMETYFGGIEAKRRPQLTVVHGLMLIVTFFNVSFQLLRSSISVTSRHLRLEKVSTSSLC